LPASLKQSWATDGRKFGPLFERRKRLFISWMEYITDVIEGEALQVESGVREQQSRFVKELLKSFRGMEHQGVLFNQPQVPKAELEFIFTKMRNIPDLIIRRLLATVQKRVIQKLAEKFNKNGIDGFKSIIKEMEE
jgi:hypothetical protein